MILLIQNLVLAGFLSLEPMLSDGGIFQDPYFVIPAPLGDGKSQWFHSVLGAGSNLAQSRSING